MIYQIILFCFLLCSVAADPVEPVHSHVMEDIGHVEQIQQIANDKAKTKEEKYAAVAQIFDQLPAEQKQAEIEKAKKEIDFSEYMRTRLESVSPNLKAIFEARKPSNNGQGSPTVDKLMNELNEADRNQLNALDNEIKSKAAEFNIKFGPNKRSVGKTAEAIPASNNTKTEAKDKDSSESSEENVNAAL